MPGILLLCVTMSCPVSRCWQCCGNVSSNVHAQVCICVWGIQTTVFTSLQARLCIIADPRSWRTALSERRELTATLVVHRMLLMVVLQYCHSDMYSSHSELLKFSNILHICNVTHEINYYEIMSSITYTIWHELHLN